MQQGIGTLLRDQHISTQLIAAEDFWIGGYRIGVAVQRRRITDIETSKSIERWLGYDSEILIQRVHGLVGIR